MTSLQYRKSLRIAQIVHLQRGLIVHNFHDRFLARNHFVAQKAEVYTYHINIQQSIYCRKVILISLPDLARNYAGLFRRPGGGIKFQPKGVILFE